MKAAVLVAAVLATMPSNTLAQTAKAPVLTNGRFEQVALTVADLPTALTFYRDRIGLRLLFEANQMLFFDVSGTRLMIAADGRRQRSATPTGILYFHVDGFEAALVRLQESGAKLIGAVEMVQSTPAGTLQLQQFEDPDGNMLAIMGFLAR